ncbi:cobalt-precorrin-5B (C(1))-methyltransferase CbiD [Tumidithrix elongata RA019]|uniref:Cobalt-precorrin-5B C(1)-methyltransferase n=1 Tax=Tumidithrix elongata BACA0141 TaxID=2716417 RepID=A0AAW9Q6C2_9CYAN|nr:cobalt-precorrin-5B (C(1))-methyltransferase CbiD [Tumidithrix elongata RA019]
MSINPTETKDNNKRAGYTLPVFAVAAAKAALVKLLAIADRIPTVNLDLGDRGEVEIAIAQVAAIDPSSALGITISDPGDNLDLTAGTPIWAWVHLQAWQGEALRLEAGEGVGHTETGEPAIYRFARQLADVNLLPLIPPERTLTVRFIFPEGRSLAQRTSNQAFGILEGLALLGTSGISQPLSAEEKLEDFRADLREKTKEHQHLAFYIGANGHQVALNLGFSERQLVQTANWVGVMLVEAALLGVHKITLVGYHGKLLKLAGGIFNTSSHLADGRMEILTAAAVAADLPIEIIKQIQRSPTAEAVHKLLIAMECEQPVFRYLTERINQRAIAYVKKYAEREIEIETILCDRLGQVI